MSLPEVIRVDKSKCQHCLACILVCPVKLCNIVERDGITVNTDLCIGCGECITACREKGHYARSGIDDFPEFLTDIEQGVQIGVIVAPAAAVNYGDLLPNVLTSLRKIGVSNVFDVSFGAEITTYLYLKALKNGAKQPIIAQPCPAIVSFIEIYQPELIPYLAPTHSPALDVAIWIKSQPEYSHLKLAFLGPCLAKRREIHDPNTHGVVSYNLTFESLSNYLDEQVIELDELAPTNFDNPEAERAVCFSQPGGLTSTFNRFGVAVDSFDIKRIEGPQEVYQRYLPELIEGIKAGQAPILVDILNCLHGCNSGPAISHSCSHYQTDRIMATRRAKQLAKHESTSDEKAKDLFKEFFTWLDSQNLDFSRVYSDKSANKHLREPLGNEEESTWNLLHKLTLEEREINCSSCGYGTCRGMLLAIINGLNHLESCKYYLFKENERNLRNVEAQTLEIEEAKDEIEGWNDVLEHTVAARTQSIRNLLDNAGQGFLSFASDLLIHNEYSSECANIFGKDIHRHKFPQLLFEDNAEQESYLATLLPKILANTDAIFREIYMPLLPTEVTIRGKFIRIDYKLIDSADNGDGGTDADARGKGGVPSRNICMAILTDVTDTRKLETQVLQERNLLKMVVNVVLSYADFKQNVKDYTYFCETRLQEILDSSQNLMYKVTEIYRQVHTFKGSFSQLGMNNLVTKLHDLETEVDNVKKLVAADAIELYDVEEFFTSLELSTWLDQDLEGLQDILGQEFFSQEDELTISGNKLIEIEKKIEMTLTPVECKILLPEIRRLRYKSFDQLLKLYPEYTTKLADRLEKSVQVSIIQDSVILVNPDRFYDFTKSLVHIFRNSVDHGLETEDERLESGKDESGQIQCTITESENCIYLEISDDGRGINVGNIRKKAVDSGLWSADQVNSLSNEEALRLIFEDGLSTKDVTDALSGRGVGLASVLSELTKLGGLLAVTTELGKGSKFSFSLPMEVEGSFEIPISKLMQPFVNTASNFMRDQVELPVIHTEDIIVNELEKIELNKVTVIINIRGAIDVVVILSFSATVMRKVVRKFILDDITPEEEESYMEDVLGEVTNIIIGNSLKEFPGLEELLVIDTPISLSSDEALVNYKESQIWVSKMQTELGDFSLSLVVPNDSKIIVD